MAEWFSRPTKYPANRGKLTFPETLNDLNQVTDRRLLSLLSRIRIQDDRLVLDGNLIEPDPVETVNTFGLVGKWFDDSKNGEPLWSTHYPGSSIVATVTGTSRVIGSFRNTGSSDVESKTVAVRLNRGEWKRLPLSESVLLADNLNPGSRYTIEIVYDGWNQQEKLWENQRKFSIRSLVLDDGASIQYSNNKKNILFVGDSITAGTKTLSNTDSPSGSSAVVTFARILSDKLNANAYHCAFPGKKVQDPFIKDNVKLVSADKSVPDYNIHSVVVMAGTNDYQYPSADFIREYQSLLNSIRDVYPNQRIYIVGLVESQVGIRRNEELRTIAQNNQNGNIKFLDTTELSGVAYTDGLHPSGAGGQTIADFLYPLFVQDGWENSNPNPNPTPDPEPTPSVPTGNLWAKGGQPTSYNPLPPGFHSMHLPISYAGNKFKLSFKAKSDTGKKIKLYTEWKADFDMETPALTSTLTSYEYMVNVTYDDSDGNYLLMIRGNNDEDEDIIIQDFSFEWVSTL